MICYPEVAESETGIVAIGRREETAERHGMAWIIPYVCRAEKAKKETNERQEQRVGDRVFHARHA